MISVSGLFLFLPLLHLCDVIEAFFVPERWSKKFFKILFVISEKSSQLVSEGKNLTNLENRIHIQQVHQKV